MQLLVLFRLQKRHFDRRRRRLPPQWRNLLLQLPLLVIPAASAAEVTIVAIWQL
jgi:hypothetical protein